MSYSNSALHTDNYRHSYRILSGGPSMQGRWTCQARRSIPSRILRTGSRRFQHTVSTPHRLTQPSPFIRPLSERSALSVEALEHDFELYPTMYTLDETAQLLKAALWKLDRVDPNLRRRRRANGASPSIPASVNGVLQELFTGDYTFEEGHFDNVIHHYRETTISSLPPSSSSIIPTLNRAFALLPGQPEITTDELPRSTITHLLHLAPHGEILPHVDNLEASGSVIMGICLGAERILRLQMVEEGQASGLGWEVLLPNGAVYVQRNKVRYQYEHSILPYDTSVWDGRQLDQGHRLSIMVRDAPIRPGGN